LFPHTKPRRFDKSILSDLPWNFKEELHMVEGKKNLPGEADSTSYPIDVEARLISPGLYEELEKAKNCIEIMRCIYEMFNTAYSLGKAGKPLDLDMVARLQGVATIFAGDEKPAGMVFILILRLYKAYAQGWKNGEKQEGGGETWEERRPPKSLCKRQKTRE